MLVQLSCSCPRHQAQTCEECKTTWTVVSTVTASHTSRQQPLAATVAVKMLQLRRGLLSANMHPWGCRSRSNANVHHLHLSLDWDTGCSWELIVDTKNLSTIRCPVNTYWHVATVHTACPLTQHPNPEQHSQLLLLFVAQRVACDLCERRLHVDVLLLIIIVQHDDNPSQDKTKSQIQLRSRQVMLQ